MTVPASTPPRPPLLDGGQQRTAAVLALSALVLLASAWWRQGGIRGGLIDIDRAPPLTAQFLLDVNNAQWAELLQLPGIGPGLAPRSLGDLQRVEGIGPRTLERIRPCLLPLPGERDWAAR